MRDVLKRPWVIAWGPRYCGGDNSSPGNSSHVICELLQEPHHMGRGSPVLVGDRMGSLDLIPIWYSLEPAMPPSWCPTRRARKDRDDNRLDKQRANRLSSREIDPSTSLVSPILSALHLLQHVYQARKTKAGQALNSEVRPRKALTSSSMSNPQRDLNGGGVFFLSLSSSAPNFPYPVLGRLNTSAAFRGGELNSRTLDWGRGPRAWKIGS
ncbi:hypothetical protein GGR58DRAFT_83639 [Xylaria digitata]|nr:hypothetical protein GGR58DRAFT_83639 [Xylaria digitata]